MSMIALRPRIAPQHTQLSFIRSEAENCVQRGGLACAIRADESEDASLFDAQDRCHPARRLFQNVLRRPRASMQAMVSAFLLCGLRRAAFLHGLVRSSSAFRSEPLNRRVDPGPFLVKKFLPFAFQQQAARPGIDEHAEVLVGSPQAPRPRVADSP